MNFIVIYGGRLLNGILLLMATRIYSSLLSDYEIGLLGSVLAILLFFSALIFFPLGSFINQKILLWISEKRWKPILSSYFTFIFFFLISLSTLSLFYLDKFVVMVGFFFLFSLSINQTFIPLLNIILFRKSFVCLTLLTSIFYILFSYYLLQSYEKTALFWLLGQSISYLIFGLFAFFLFVKFTESNFKINFYFIKKYDYQNLFNFAFPLAITSLCAWLVLNFFKVSGGIFVNLEQIAILVLCSVLSSGIFGAIESATFQYFHAEFLNDLNKAEGNDSRKECFEIFFKKVFLILLFSLVILLIFSPLIIKIALDQRFQNFYFIFQIFLVADFLKNINHLISQFAYAEFKTNLLLKGNFYAAAFSSFSILFIFIIQPSYFITTIPIFICVSYLISIFFQYNNAKETYGKLNLLR